MVRLFFVGESPGTVVGMLRERFGDVRLQIARLQRWIRAEIPRSFRWLDIAKIGDNSSVLEFAELTF